VGEECVLLEKTFSPSLPGEGKNIVFELDKERRGELVGESSSS